MYTQVLKDVFDVLPVDIILWCILAVVLIFFAVYSAILLWHWKEYSTGKYTTVTNMFTYLAVSACTFVCMAVTAVWYSLI